MQLFVRKNSLEEKSEEEKPVNFFVATWRTYTRQTTIHLVHYLSDNSFCFLEKVLWALSIITATAGMIYCSFLLSERFSNSKTSTVFESTNFKVSEIPFAAITICNNNRQDYNKTQASLEKFLPNRTKKEEETFIKFIHILQNQEFGSFDEFTVLKDDDLTTMESLNITEVYEFLMHDCEVFFVSCWWRNKPFKCCEWFSKQRTEYGICWSFNSFTNVGSSYINLSF